MDDQSTKNDIDLLAIEQAIRKIISDQLNVPIANVNDNARFQDDLNADSLDMVEIIMAMEDDSGIHIGEESIEGIITVKQMIDYVVSLLTTQNQAQNTSDQALPERS